MSAGASVDIYQLGRMSNRNVTLLQHLNREYSPSAWSKRFSDRNDVISNHIRHIRTESNASVQEIKCELDIPYGNNDEEKLDMFGIDLPDDSPILVFVHGGFWHEFTKEESRYFVKALHEKSIKTVVIGYDLCPKVTIRQIIDQIKTAASFIFDYANNKKSKGVYFIGHSAGAHLVAKLLSDVSLLKSSKSMNVFRGVFLVSGVYDLTELVKTDENKYLELTPEEAKRLSPHFDNYFHMRDVDLRIYILAAENDSYTFRKQSRNFYDMLMECCQVQNIHFEIKDKLDHFDIMEILSESDNYLCSLILEDVDKHFNKRHLL